MKLSLTQKAILFSIILIVMAGTTLLFVFLNRETDKDIVRIGVVVPHHDIKKNFRLELWDKICKSFDCASVEKVIILAPNHFDADQKRIVYATEDWTTHKGNRKNLLQNLTGAEIDNNKVHEDHGVVNLLSEIVSNFPNADIGAVLIGNKVEFRKLEHLISKVKEICEKSCTIVASVDFSHEVTEEQAKKQDARTIEFLKLGNLKDGDLFVSTTRAEVDSPQALYVLQQFGKNFNKKFELYKRTSSNELNENAIVTSHVLGIWK